jgi:hypothetical protein
MTVKLVKRTEAVEDRVKQDQPATPRQLVQTAQSWVAEFKARKAIARPSLDALMKHA